MEDTWEKVDACFEKLFIGEDEALAYALENSRRHDLPSIQVSPCQGRLLQILVEMSGAKRVLEVGTLGGYSTICLARGVGSEGEVVTIEARDHHADVAAANLRHAGMADRVRQLRGDARAALQKLVEEQSEPFDFVFLDADKESNPVYLEYALQLARPGTVIIGDNVVRDGKVADEANQEASIVATRAFCKAQGEDEQLLATAIQTVGVKGYDGFTIAVVR